MRWLIVLLGMVWGTASIAEPRFTPPEWRSRPSADVISAFYPAAAMGLHETDGRAVIVCTVAVDGTLRGCRIASESPPGYGFGTAAIALSTQFRMVPAEQDGRQVEAEVRIPITFRYPETATGPEPAAETVQLATRVMELFVANAGWDDMVSRFAHPLLYPNDPRAVITPDERALIARVTRRLGEEYRPRFLHGAAVALARRMGAADLGSAIAFLSTPAGRSFSEQVIPALSASSTAMDRMWSDFARDFRIEFCQRSPTSRMCRLSPPASDSTNPPEAPSTAPAPTPTMPPSSPMRTLPP